MPTDSYREDLSFMQHPEVWPSWPFLPLKKRNDFDFNDDNSFAVMVAGDKPTVYIGANIFSLADKKQKLSEMTPTVYSSIEIAAQDWMVD